MMRVSQNGNANRVFVDVGIARCNVMLDKV